MNNVRHFRRFSFVYYLLSNDSFSHNHIMSSRFFHPWVGSRYITDGYLGKRVLLLGESNYLPPEGGTAQPWMTSSIIEGLAIPQGNGYSDRVLRLVTGSDSPLSRTQREDFWQRVAFCNFIQAALTGPRVRPTPAMWAAGHAPLLQTISELEPQAILVLGVGVGWHLPAIPAGISVLRLKHPSSFGFSRKKWVPKIHAFLTSTVST